MRRAELRLLDTNEGEQDMTTLSLECACGRPRAGCDYHDPALQPKETILKAVIKQMATDFEQKIGRSSIQRVHINAHISLPTADESFRELISLLDARAPNWRAPGVWQIKLDEGWWLQRLYRVDAPDAFTVMAAPHQHKATVAMPVPWFAP
jgi:hypothetical protein